MTTPIRDLGAEYIEKILYGSGTERIVLTYASKSGRSREYRAHYEGIIPNIERRFKETESEFVREELAKYMSPRPCPTCKGARLKPEVLAVTIAGRNIREVVNYSVLAGPRLLRGARGPCSLRAASRRDAQQRYAEEFGRPRVPLDASGQRRGGGSVPRRARSDAHGPRVRDRPPDLEGDPRTAAISGRRRARLSDAESHGGHALRW